MAEMEYQLHGLLPEECCTAINRIASFQMHMSDAYSSMACYYNAEEKLPALAFYLDLHGDRKREHAKKFLRFLRRREGIICLPVVKRPDNWPTGIQALAFTLELEKQLYDMLQDLRTKASITGEDELFDFLQVYAEEQKKSIAFLEKELARSNPETPAVTSGEHSESQSEQHNP